MEEDQAVNQQGSGAVAQDHSVAAGAGGVAVGRDVHGDVTVINVTDQGVEIAIPSPEAIAAHRASLREQLEADARARWGGMSVYIQEEGATLPIEASPYQTGRLGPRENLLETLHAASRLLVLGEPGAGKTVALERLGWELCDGQGPTIPVLVRLFHYAGTPLAAWVRSILQATGHLRLDDERALAAFLKEGEACCTFLFDGLNEVPPAYRDHLVDELVRWMAAYPEHPVILTSRAQDELWRRLRGEVDQTVVVQPISDEQARAYLVAHLSDKGEALYRQLDRRLQELARMPLVLWLIKDAVAADESVPGNRGELYARFVSRMLRRDTDRRMDAEIPDRVKRQALSDLAYHLGLQQRLTCRREEAEDVVSQRLEGIEGQEVVAACAQHGLLSGEEAVWFAPHQTVQEHFAALALRDLAQQEWQQGAWGRLRLALRQILTGQRQGLAGLAADDWWGETFVQLAGLVEDTDRLAQEVARANPWLAWWCVQEGQAVSETTRVWVEDRSARLLRSERTSERRRAVQALSRMQSDRTVEPLFQAASDPDAEIAALAVGALAGMGEAARAPVGKALRGTDRRLWRAALRYLGTRASDPLWAEIPAQAWEEVLDLSMVRVPAGSFLMGSDQEKDPQADRSELPQHSITLPGYWIGRYPVTVAQFRAFVAASRHRPRDSESLNGPSEHPVVNVTWHDALAYCRWLGEQTGLPVTLPSEAEWEKAARGTDGRIYPWGDEPPDESLCNFSLNVGETTPVGRYSPRGDSPYGCADMAGNVWEWTRSIWREYPYDPEDGREDLEAGDEALRVLRGGSFSSSQRRVRCAYRDHYFPLARLTAYGFRCVVAPVASER